MFNRKAYSKKYREENREKLRAQEKQRYWNNLERERLRCRKTHEYDLTTQQKYQSLRTATEAKRRFTKRCATPNWLTPLQKQQINEVYQIARELSWLSEGSLEVDHIIPLKGKLVTGLHVPWNLQILPAAWNNAKGNKVT